MLVSAQPATLPLTPDQVAAFHTDGFVIARGIIPRRDIDGIRDQLALVTGQAIAGWKAKGEITDDGADLPFETRFARVAAARAGDLGRSWRREVACPALHRLHHGPLADAVAQIAGPEIDGHPVWNARPKLPGQQLTTVPWHQDSSYFGPQTTRSLLVTAWVPLVPVDERNGTLQLARGTHRIGLVHHVTEERDGKFLEIQGGDPAPELVETAVMAPGDVILLHNLCWHRSLDNRSDGIRWSIDVRFARTGDDPGWEKFPCPWPVRSATRPQLGEAEWLRHSGALGW